MRKMKVLDIKDSVCLECYKLMPVSGEKQPINMYRVYIVYNAATRYNYGYSKHRKQIAAYDDMISVLCFIKDLYLYCIGIMPINQIIDFCKKYHEQK